jgi:AcrR family transcriptional regulator
MGRPRLVDNAQIIDVARSMFLEHGVRISIASIARRVGVSEGTIFKRFPTKESLFFAAMGLPTPPDLESFFAGRPGQGDVRQHLVDGSVVLIAFLRKLLPNLIVLRSHSAFDPRAFFRADEDPPPRRIVRGLAAYILAEQEAGRIRSVDSNLVARTLVGALHNFVFFEMTGMHDEPTPDTESFARQLVDLLWTGLGPERESAVGVAGTLQREKQR